MHMTSGRVLNSVYLVNFVVIFLLTASDLAGQTTRDCWWCSKEDTLAYYFEESVRPEFNAAGKITSEEFYKTHGSGKGAVSGMVTIDYEWNASGMLTKRYEPEIYYEGDEEWEYQYDSKNNLISIKKTNFEDTVTRDVRIAPINADTSYRSIVKFPFNDLFQIRSFVVTDDFNADGSARVSREFDIGGLKTADVFHGKWNGTHITDTVMCEEKYFVDRFCDNDDRQIREVKRNTGDSILYDYEFIYDNSGNLVEKRDASSSSLGESFVYVYNDDSSKIVAAQKFRMQSSMSEWLNRVRFYARKQASDYSPPADSFVVCPAVVVPEKSQLLLMRRNRMARTAHDSSTTDWNQVDAKINTVWLSTGKYPDMAVSDVGILSAGVLTEYFSDTLFAGFPAYYQEYHDTLICVYSFNTTHSGTYWLCDDNYLTKIIVGDGTIGTVKGKEFGHKLLSASISQVSYGAEYFTVNLPLSAYIRVDIHDMRGKRIGTIFEGISAAGRNMVEIPSSVNGRKLGAGQYILRLTSGLWQCSTRAGLLSH